MGRRCSDALLNLKQLTDQLNAAKDKLATGQPVHNVTLPDAGSPEWLKLKKFIERQQKQPWCVFFWHSQQLTLFWESMFLS